MIYIYIYIYIGRFFCNFLFKLTRSGWVGSKFGPDFHQNLDPTWTRFKFFFFKTQTRPYFLSNQVKPDLLGSGWARYLRVRLKLPSLHGTRHAKVKVYENRITFKDQRGGQQAIENMVHQTHTPIQMDSQCYAHTQERWEGKNVRGF